MSEDTKKDDLDFLAALNLRERRLVQALADGVGYIKAMRLAGYARSTALKQSARTRWKPRIMRALLEIQYRRGHYLTDDELVLIGKDPAEERLREDLALQVEAKREAGLILARQMVGPLRR